MSQALWGQVVVASVAVIGSILGYVLAGFNDARRDRHNAVRDHAARAEDRVTTALLEQQAFQRATLLELQDAIQLMTRLTGRAMHFDHMQARNGKYTQLPPNYSDEMHENGVNVARLRNRLLNDELRERVTAFESQCTNMTMLPTRYQERSVDAADTIAFDAMQLFNLQVTSVVDAVGNALRANLRALPPQGNVPGRSSTRDLKEDEDRHPRQG